MNDLGAASGEVLTEALKLREAAEPGTFEQYLYAIFGENWKTAIFAGWFEDGEKRAPVLRLGKRYNTVVGQYEDVVERASELRAKGVALPCFHMCINVVKAHAESRRADSFECSRLVCVDIDRGITKKTVKELVSRWQPSFIVKSSVHEGGEDVEGRRANYHFYWKCEDLDMAAWAQVQLSLAWSLDGDMSKTNASASLRAPGFERVSKSGSRCIPGLVVLSEKVWDRVGLVGLFSGEIGGLAEAYKQAKEKRKAGYDNIKKALAEKKGLVGAGAAGGLSIEQLSQVGRNNYLYHVLKNMASGGAGIEELEERARELNEGFGAVGAGASGASGAGSLDEREVESVVRSAYEKGHSRFEGRKAELGEMLKTKSAGKMDKKEKQAMPLHLVPSVPSVPAEKVTLEEICTAMLEEGAKELKQETQKKGANGSSGDILVVEDSEDGLPNSKGDTGLILSRSLMTEEGLMAFREAFVSHNYLGLAEIAMDKFNQIGTVKPDGLYVMRRSVSSWGDTCFAKERVPKDQNSVFFSQVLHNLVQLIWDAQVEEDSTEAIDREIVAIRNVMIGPKGNKATTALLDRMGRKLMENVLSEVEEQEAQSPDVIVYQNGVLHLGGREGQVGTMFVKDRYSPARYSNPIAAVFDEAFAAKVLGASMEGEASGAGALLTDVEGLAKWVKRELPVWSKYMQDWFPGDSGAISLMLRLTGMCMTTDVSFQKFLFFYGPGGAGKGSNAQVIEALVGRQNVCSIKYKDLGRPFAVSAAKGRLLAIVDEVNGKVEDHEDRMNSIKQCTSGGYYQFEKKHCDPIDGVFTAKLLLQSNEAPEYTDKGGSIARRMIAVGFERSFSVHNSGSAVIRNRLGEVIVSERYDHKEPKTVILAAEAVRLATLAGLVWRAARYEKKPFAVGGRAVEVGQKEIMDSMQKQRKVLERFLKTAPMENEESILPKRAVVELVVLGIEATSDFEGDTDSLDTEGKKFQRTLSQDVVALFPGVDSGARVRIKEEGQLRHVRAFGHIMVNWEAMVAEGLLEIEADATHRKVLTPSWAITYPVLWKAIVEQIQRKG